jgi:hypothetical protein
VYGLAVAAARSDDRLPSAEREAVAERYASGALAVLQKLREEGYFKDPDHAGRLRKDAELQPLRDRPDFQRLLTGTERDRQK